MKLLDIRIGLVAVLAWFLLAAGCGDDASSDPTPTGPEEAVPMPDFSLVDVNPTSPTHDDRVSPRDYLEQISAWYFGHAT